MAPAPGALLELKFRGERQSDGRLPTHSRDSPGVRQPLTIAVKMTLRMERPLWMSSNDRLSDRLGEGFRMPAITGRASGHGPAYGNRPCTNPQGCGDGLWGFEVLLCCGDGETGCELESAGTC